MTDKEYTDPEWLEQFEDDIKYIETRGLVLKDSFSRETLHYMKDWTDNPLLDAIIDIKHEKYEMRDALICLYASHTSGVFFVPVGPIILWAKMVGRIELKYELWKVENGVN